MREIIFAIISILLFSACSQTNSGSATAIEKSDTIVIENDTVPNLDHIAYLDSIEATNNASVKASGSNVTKAHVSRQDSSISLTADIRLDHRFFGYSNSDLNSERLLLFSVFTNDVEKNPFGCKLGSYYDTRGMQNIKLKFLQTDGNFIKAMATDSSNNLTTLYFERKWIVLE
jgi:uncharacterized protein YcfL